MERQSLVLNSAIAPLTAALVWCGVDAEKMFVLAILMGIDLIAGLVKAFKLGEDVTSRKLSAGVLAKVLVLTIPLVLALTAKGVAIDLLWLVTWSLSALVVSECYSIIGNIYAIKTGQKVREIDALSYLVKGVGRILEGILKVDSK